MGCEGPEEAIRPPLLPRIDALFLPEPREKEPVFSSSLASSPPSHQPFRGPDTHSHGRRLHLEEVLVVEALVVGGLAGSEICEGHIEALLHHRLLPSPSQVLVRIPGAEIAPTPAVGEVVVFNEHFYRGFGLPASAFFSEWLHFFSLQPHHMAPNAILQLSAFVVLCERFLGIEPRVNLWRSLFFFKQQSIAMEKSEVEKLAGPRPMMPCGIALVHHRSKSVFPQLPLQESIKQWQRGFFYVKNADPAQDALNMPPFNVELRTKLNCAAKTPKPIAEVAQICAYLEILEKGGLLGRDQLTTMVARRILPLQRRPHLVCQMSGRHDPCKMSTKRFTPGAVARRVNLIFTAHMDDNGNWLWGMTPSTGPARLRW
ncbi:hypothetical protein D1007_42155 [Hordeum vulgare]|nr:hypothetical protein D1007_42155 [Hordeum vulgare]